MSIGAVEPAATEPAAKPGIGNDGSGMVASHAPIPADQRPLTVVNGEVRLRERIVELWNSRELLVLFTKTELKVKYKNSVLGFLWSMLNPAMILAIYYVVFAVINKNNQPHFAIWLFAGLLVWNLFNNAAMGSTVVVVGKAGIVKKVSFPRELLALSTVGVALVLFGLQLIVLVLAMVLFQLTPDWTFLALLPLATLALLVFTSAVSIFLSAVNVYLRDTQHLTEVLLQAWFWGTPVVYTYGSIATKLAHHPSLLWLKWIFVANPVTPVAMAFQRAIYGVTSYTAAANVNPARLPTPLLPTFGIGEWALGLFAVLLVSIGLFMASLVVFSRLEGNFAEEL